MKKTLFIFFKTLFIFFISTIVIYLILTFTRLQQWCNQNQIILYVNKNIGMEHLDFQRLEIYGSAIERQRELITKTYPNLSSDAIEGYIEWLNFQSAIGRIFSYYLLFSVVAGLAIACGYYLLNIIKEKKVILTLLLGYLIPIGIFILIYMLTFKANPFATSVDRDRNIILFFKIYLLAFILMIIFNNKKKKNINKIPTNI